MVAAPATGVARFAPTTRSTKGSRSSVRGASRDARFARAVRRATTGDDETDDVARDPSSNASTPDFPSIDDERARGKTIALAAFATGVFAFGVSTTSGVGGGDAIAGANLSQLEKRSTSLDAALSSGKPTVLEFYADWCEVCKESAPTVYAVETAHASGVNFVMLNIDNTKWGGELDAYGVDGIPHLEFLDKDGVSEGFIVGKFPKEVLEANVAALERGEKTLPYAKKYGLATTVQAPDIVAGASSVGDPRGGIVPPSTDPRAHG